MKLKAAHVMSSEKVVRWVQVAERQGEQLINGIENEANMSHSSRFLTNFSAKPHYVTCYLKPWSNKQYKLLFYYIRHYYLF